jgi:hypothetical protein
MLLIGNSGMNIAPFSNKQNHHASSGVSVHHNVCCSLAACGDAVFPAVRLTSMMMLQHECMAGSCAVQYIHNIYQN